MKKHISIAGLFVTILIFLSGCGPSAVAVRNRPEPPYYSCPSAPGPSYMWVNDAWMRSGRHYHYRQGYSVPLRPRDRQYRAGHWQQRRDGWYWVAGRWN
ncbi:MAG: hypothetical protein ABIN25_10375 [Ginsengibacter sp.]